MCRGARWAYLQAFVVVHRNEPVAADRLYWLTLNGGICQLGCTRIVRDAPEPNPARKVLSRQFTTITNLASPYFCIAAQ